MTVKRPRSSRLSTKVLLIILGLVVLPLLVVGGTAGWWVAQAFESRLQRWIHEAAVVSESWLHANQSSAAMLGQMLADDPEYLRKLQNGEYGIPKNVQRIASELAIGMIQIHDRDGHVLYANTSDALLGGWEFGQRQAIVPLMSQGRSLLAAVGITPLPKDNPRFFVVFGTLLDADFLEELTQLTGLQSRVYYKEGDRWYDIFSDAAHFRELSGLGPEVWRQLLYEKRAWYSSDAEQGAFRGQYTPLVDVSGHVEGILFNGLEHRGIGSVEEILTSGPVLFSLISLLGVIIAAATGWLLSRIVLRPINALRSGVLQLAGQNYNATVPVYSSDELGDLGRAFNAMAISLRAARDEQQLTYQRDKLVALGELSAALAHEIRNPVGVINTASALLEKAEGDANKQHELIRMIRDESLRVGRLVQDFLQLSRHRKPELAVINPVDPLENALKTTLAGRTNIVVDKSYQHGETKIIADATLLQQAWMTIINNALQAIGDAYGTLYITVTLEDADVIVALEDTGPGIAPEVMPRLFEPFFTTKEHGTGLGLYIAYTLVDTNGGHLEVLPPQRSGARVAMRFAVYQEDA